MNPAQFLLRVGLRAYQRIISPALTSLFGPLGFGCRFEPTCSHYAIEAIQLHGAARGSWLTARRLCRCHPWGGCGHDPVPPVPGLAPTSSVLATPPIESRTGSNADQSRSPQSSQSWRAA